MGEQAMAAILVMLLCSVVFNLLGKQLLKPLVRVYESLVRRLATTVKNDPPNQFEQ